jgi:hypothetical protein
MDDIEHLIDVWYVLRNHMVDSHQPLVIALGPKPAPEEPEFTVTFRTGRKITLVTKK